MSDNKQSQHRIMTLRKQDGEISIYYNGHEVGITMKDPQVAGIVRAWLLTAIDDLERVIKEHK